VVGDSALDSLSVDELQRYTCLFPSVAEVHVSPQGVVSASVESAAASAAVEGKDELEQRDLDQQQGDKIQATGFMASPTLMLTNHHVLPTLDRAQRATVRFGLTDADACWANLDPSVCYIADEELDFALVAVSQPLPYPFSPIPLVDPSSPLCDPQRQAWRELSRNAGVRSMQRSQGKPRLEVRGGVYALQWLAEHEALDCPKDVPHPPEVLLYTQPAVDGSSGSPVFDTLGRLIALHTGWVYADEVRDGSMLLEELRRLPKTPADGQRRVLFAGLYVGRLVQHLRWRVDRISVQEHGGDAQRLLRVLLGLNSDDAASDAAAAGPPLSQPRG
jgi:hypothetical protein